MTIEGIKTNIYPQTYKVQENPSSNVLTSPINNSGETSPIVDAPHVAGYFPNMKVATPEEKFDLAIKFGVPLSDGSILLRPTMIGSSSEITPNDDGTYTVKTKGSRYGAPVVTKIMTEEELMASPSLYSGKLKPLDDGTYEITYNPHCDSLKQPEPLTFNLNKQGVINLMKLEHLHF